MAGALRLAAAFALLWLLGGCLGVTTENVDGERQRWSRAEFREYTAAVFRRQNTLVGEVIMLAEDAIDSEPADMDRIYAAEDAMHTACEPLNRIAARMRGDEQVRIEDRLDVVPTVPRCDAAASRLQALLAAFPSD